MEKKSVDEFHHSLLPDSTQGNLVFEPAFTNHHSSIISDDNNEQQQKAKAHRAAAKSSVSQFTRSLPLKNQIILLVCCFPSPNADHQLKQPSNCGPHKQSLLFIAHQQLNMPLCLTDAHDSQTRKNENHMFLLFLDGCYSQCILPQGCVQPTWSVRNKSGFTIAIFGTRVHGTNMVFVL